MTEAEEPQAEESVAGDGGPTITGAHNRQTLVDIAEGFRSSQEGGGSEEPPAEEGGAAPALEES